MFFLLLRAPFVLNYLRMTVRASVGKYGVSAFWAFRQSIFFVIIHSLPPISQIKKCAPLRDTPKSVPLECYHTFCPRQRVREYVFTKRQYSTLEMGVYSKMCGAYIIHQNPVIVNMDFGISPRESERGRHILIFMDGYSIGCKVSPYVSLGYTLLKHHQSVSNESEK